MASVKKLLHDRGIDDPDAYLEEASDERIETGDRTDFTIKGSVHLMLGRVITRREIEERLERLRHV